MQSPGYYAHGRGPQVPKQVKLEASCHDFNQMLLNEMLPDHTVNFQLKNLAYDKKFSCEIYGHGICPVHMRVHHSNNWVVMQPHAKEVKRGGRKFMDTMPNAVISCYHKCGVRKCCPNKKSQEILFLNGPLLL